MRMIKNRKVEKLLDKYTDKVYNTVKHDDEFISLFPKHRNFLNHAFFTDQYIDQNNVLMKAWENVYEAFPNGDKNNPPMVFAGGMFRDLFRHKFPNDLDLFINTHGMSFDEARDSIDLFILEIAKIKGLTKISTDVTGISLPYFVNRQEDEKEPFIIHNFYLHIHDINQFGFGHCFIQIIGKDFGRHLDNPLDYVRDFYYNHVMIASPITTKDSLDIYVSREAQLGLLERTNIYYTEKAKEKCLAKIGYKNSDKEFKLYRQDTVENKPKTPFNFLKQNDPYTVKRGKKNKSSGKKANVMYNINGSKENFILANGRPINMNNIYRGGNRVWLDNRNRWEEIVNVERELAMPVRDEQ